jgi:adenylate cyclase
MDKLSILGRWLAREGRLASGNLDLFQRFCEQVAALAPLDRSWLHLRALHPQYAGVSRLWTREAGGKENFLSHGFEKTATYLRSPVRFAVEQRQTGRWRLDGNEALPSPTLDDLRSGGYRDYIIAPLIYSDGTPNALSWATRQDGGFGEDDLQLFHDLLPAYAAIAEIKSLRRFVVNVLNTYEGREPGELILKGQVQRGDVRTITAALMLVDLRGFTTMSDSMEPAQVILALNRYFDCVIPAVTKRNGDVMEIMGDGVLAIFNESAVGGPAEACRLAFEAAQEGIAAIERSNKGLVNGAPQLSAGFALHYGTVAYGNIGTNDRLDFTVIGRDVNMTSRIERLCRELGRPLIMSGVFAGKLAEPMFEIGHFALRGFSEMQLLFGRPLD